jgi:hypothetical protein
MIILSQLMITFLAGGGWHKCLLSAKFGIIPMTRQQISTATDMFVTVLLL